MTLQKIWLCLAIACVAWAHRMCDACIPLEDLLMPGFGVSVSIDGLSSAVAYHNGTVSAISATVASEEYRDLMLNVLTQHQTDQQRSTIMRCDARPSLRAKPWDKDILKLVRSYARRLLHRIRIGSESLPARSPPDPITEMLQAQFLALEPFASMNAELRSRVTLAIQIPVWLMSSPYACNLLEAADTTFHRVVGLESPSSAAFTALGYELCRVDHDAFDCTGPGNLATIEYDGQVAIASTTKTPIGAFDRFHTRYSILRSTNSLELAEWINSYLDRINPDMTTLAGTHTAKGTFKEALGLSKVAGRFVSHKSIDAEAILVAGAAQVAKDALENHESDCGEFDDCLDIRAEADKLAGEYVYTKPTKWPATNSRHWKQWQQHSKPATDPFISTPFILQNPSEL